MEQLLYDQKDASFPPPHGVCVSDSEKTALECWFREKETGGGTDEASGLSFWGFQEGVLCSKQTHSDNDDYCTATATPMRIHRQSKPVNEKTITMIRALGGWKIGADGDRRAILDSSFKMGQEDEATNRTRES
jgi:hypothetical protein